MQPLELAPFSTLSAIICIPLKKNNVKKDIQCLPLLFMSLEYQPGVDV